MKPGAYTLEIRTSTGTIIRAETYVLFSQLLAAVRKQPPSRHLYAYDASRQDSDSTGLTEEQQDLLLEACQSR